MNDIFAQSRITSVIQGQSGYQTSYGRDFWLCIPQNSTEGDNAQKYFTIYVSAFRNTTVNFQVQGSPLERKPVTANGVTLFTTPTPQRPSTDFNLTTELTSSGIVESTKAIHIWSDDADLSVSFLSRVPYSSDGMYVLPTTQWGKEYVVGAYASNIALPNTFDSPSEFAVVANQDNTLLEITPTQDIRVNGQPDAVLHKKGITFQEKLNRGECVQYKVTRAQDESWDVTGTVVTSNNPIGVIGASTCPYIPATDQACDFIIEMMQPVTSWSNFYLTAPFAGRTYGGDGFLVVGTKDGQVIYPTPGTQITVEKYRPFFAYDIDVNTPLSWKSDAPFMLMQYVLGSTHDWPGVGKRNQGDPASVVINPVSQFQKKTIFQIPVILLGSGQTFFTNYVNVLVPTAHLAQTTYDGQVLAYPPPNNTPPPPPADVATVQKLTIGTTGWTAVRLIYQPSTGGPTGGAGTHIIVSDTGVGVYIYGYGTDDSYAMSGFLGGANSPSTDTIPPIAITSGTCFSQHINLFDSAAKASKIGYMNVDSVFNMVFSPDTNFVAGVGIGSTFYDLNITDNNIEAYAAISVYDIAENRTIITSTYKPEILRLQPAILNFGKVKGGVTEYLYDTLINSGKLPYQFMQTNLLIADNGKGFSIDSSGADGTLAPGQMRIIKIKYSSQDSVRSVDSLFVSDSCQRFMLILAVNNLSDYSLSDFNFGCIDTGTWKKLTATIATNTGSNPIGIVKIVIEDTNHFAYSGTLPVDIAENGTTSFDFTYTAKEIEFDTTIVHFYSPEAGERSAKLTGCGQAHVSVRTEGYSSLLPKNSSEYILISSQLDQSNGLVMLPPVPNPASSGTVRFVFGLSSDSYLDLSLFDILGRQVARVAGGFYPAGIYETEFALSPNLAQGSYIYRVAGDGRVISGRLIIGE